MNIALILAGGKGFRMGSYIPKQFLPIAGRTMILRTMDIFEKNDNIDKICIVCAKEWIDKLKKLLEAENYSKISGLIIGGKDRQQSSSLGLSYLNDKFSNDSIVLIHDAARPLVSQRIISESISCAKKHSACLAVIPAKDTVYKSLDSTTVNSIPDRKTIFFAQTPQTFKLSLIYNAYQKLSDTKDFTDDASILVSQGTPVKLIKGEIKNIKITSLEDIAIAEKYLNYTNTD